MMAMVWLKASYQPTTLFSLRPSWATSSGGKSLLLPTPYALKLAVLDVVLRTGGHVPGEVAWPWIRDLQIGAHLPRQIVVTNLFAKILKLRRNQAPAGAADAGPFQKTIGYREYVYHPEPIHLAFGVPEDKAAQLREWLAQINYLGKRGGFVQLLAEPQIVERIDGFVMLTAEAVQFPKMGLVQRLDDCSPKMSFAHADIYNKKKPVRIIRHIVLPYRLTRSSRSYSLYERT
ncbi:MAG TPA: hypothetical protein EYP41_13750 [Anaerolineae bacterium]|nr:hypothetical protein [Anaerolineae bacterium]